MGTRHLVAAYVDGQPRIAQYGQWDGYPTGQGKTVLKFLRETLSERNIFSPDKKLDPAKVDVFKRKLRATRFVEEAEHKAMWAEAGADGGEWVTMDVSDRMQYLYPAMSRNTGAEILELVYRHEPGIRLNNSISFAGDGLFCEWAYVVDFDAMTLEVYQGFNRGDGGRFADLPSTDSKKEYKPVGLIKTYDLNNLPTEEQFLADLKEPDEDE
jgi:hypothetical protein